VNALAIVLALSLGPAAGFKAGTPTPTSDVSNSRVTSTGSTTARALKDWTADVVNVLGFIPSAYHAGIAARTDTHDLTAYIQEAITAAGKGTVFFPLGLYNHTGILISDSVTLMGAGWSWDGSTLQNTHATNHGVSIINPDMVGARLFNLNIKGYANVNPAVTGSAIYVKGEGNNVIERVYGTWGYHGLLIEGHTSVLTVRECAFQNNLFDGIYGRGRQAAQINAVNIDTVHSHVNGRHGLNLWPSYTLNVQGSTFQGNGEAGVYFDGTGIGTSASASGVTIEKNHMEANSAGAIVALTSYDSVTGERHDLLNMTIEDNVMSVHNPDLATSAVVSLKTSALNPFESYAGLYIGRNFYEQSGGIGFVDFGGAHAYRSVLDLSRQVADAYAGAFMNPGALTVKGVEHWPRVGVVGDASPALESRSSSRIIRFTATLTANRTVTLPVAGMTHGDQFRIVRTGLGAFTLDVGPGLKTIPNSTAAWVDVAYDGSAWVLTGYGTL
jgi:hypothetical protein